MNSLENLRLKIEKDYGISVSYGAFYLELQSLFDMIERMEDREEYEMKLELKGIEIDIFICTEYGYYDEDEYNPSKQYIGYKSQWYEFEADINELI